MGAGDGASRRFFRALLPGFAEKLELPVNFVRTVIGEREWNTVRMRSSLRKLWHIKMHMGSNGTYFYGAEWLQFIEAHDLQIGYFLIFDHDSGTDFNVTIYDRSSCLKIYPPIVDDEDDNEDIDSANKPSVDNLQQSYNDMQAPLGIHRKACFTSIIGPHNLQKKGYLNVPRGFVSLCNLTGISIFLLVNSKGKWPVNLLHSLKGNKYFVKFGQGWRNFAADNELIEGDSCTFLLLSEESNVMRFWVTKQHQKPRKNSIGTQTEELDTSYFKITVKHHNLSHKAYVRIPSWFSRLHCISSWSMVLLMDPKGKSWLVHIIRSHENGRLNLRLSAGWRDFARRNKLKIGDICTFKLAFRGQRPEMTVEVSKCRASKRSKKEYSIWYASISKTIDNPSAVEDDTSSLRVDSENNRTGGNVIEAIDSAMDDTCITKENADKTLLKLDDEDSKVVFTDIEDSTSPDDRTRPICRSREIVSDSNQRENLQKEGGCKSKDPNEASALRVDGESKETNVTAVEDFDSAMDNVHIDVQYDGKTPSKLNYKNNSNDVMDIEDATQDNRTMPICSSKGRILEEANQREFFQMEQKRKHKISPWGLSEKGPKFAVTLKPYHIASKGYLNIPNSYEGLKYLHDKQRVTLVDEGQQVWHVKLYQNISRNYFRLGSGWHLMCHDKGLDVGDECTFELVWTGSDVLMQLGMRKKQAARIKSGRLGYRGSGTI